ncbi:MAG: hypothetical protein QGI25_17490 [Arenicellales bacterium]|nr:hypothetical protein [Arenicellales bacterium]
MLLAYEGQAQAQYQLGLMFSQGAGMIPSPEEATYWFNRAAEQNHAGAQYQLGATYLNGKGLRADRERGMEWWRAAAKGGSTAAQYGLGRAYLYGAGVRPDREVAIRWLDKASQGGHVEARELLVNLDNYERSGTLPGDRGRYGRVGPGGVWIYTRFNRLSLIIAEAEAGGLVRVLERQADWYLVELPQPIEGWLATDLVAHRAGDQVVAQSGATLKVQLSTETAEPVLEVPDDRPLTVLESRKHWLRVRSPGLITGWIPILGLASEYGSTPVLETEWSVVLQLLERSGDSKEAPEQTSGIGSVGTAGSRAVLEVPPSDDRQTADDSPPVQGSIALQSKAIHAADPVSARLPPSETPIVRRDAALQNLLDDNAHEQSGRLMPNEYDWLFSRDPNGFTLELFGSTSEVLIRRFIGDYDFQDHIAYFSSALAGRRWFTVLQGAYPDLASVRKALSELPVKLDTVRVRRLSAVVGELCRNFDGVSAAVLTDLEQHCGNIPGR